MPGRNETLKAAAERLEKVLDENKFGPDQGWTDRVDRALADIEQAVQVHASALQPADGRIVKVDRPRLPSPGVDRRAAALRQELDELLRETTELRAKVKGVAAAFGVNVNPSGLAGALPVAPEAGALPDFGVFRQRVKHLADGLERYEEEEAHLILDSVNTDIGAGD